MGINVRVGQQCIHCGVEIRGLWVGISVRLVYSLQEVIRGLWVGIYVRIGQQCILCGWKLVGYMCEWMRG